MNYVRGRARTIVVNTSFRMAPWADVLYACDAGWWRHYFSEVAAAFVPGELWTTAPMARDQFKIHWVFGAPRAGLALDKTSINHGLNSGYQAIGLAALFGAKRILLLGYDFQASGGRMHWHPDHPKNLGNGGRIWLWVQEMTQLAADLKKAGIEVVNCSRQTALSCYPRSTIQEAL